MKFLIQLWRILSFPLILGGLGAVWYGIHHWQEASADKVVTTRELFANHLEVALLKEPLRFDLTNASVRQENFMGVKSPAVAVFPAWPEKDLGRARLVILSSRPSFLGPVVKSFQRVDSGQGAIHVQSNSKTSTGTLLPQFEAMIQTLEADLRLHLDDSTKGNFLAQGTAIRKTDPLFLGTDSTTNEYWEVRLEGVPSHDKVLTLLTLGIAAIVLGIALQIVVKKWETAQEEEAEEERANEKPLV